MVYSICSYSSMCSLLRLCGYDLLSGLGIGMYSFHDNKNPRIGIAEFPRLSQTNNAQNIYMTYQKRDLDSEEVRIVSGAIPFQVDDIKYLFDYVDEDKDGLITFDELRKILIEADINMDFDLLFDLLEQVNPEKKEKYDLDMVIHFFQIRPEDENEWTICLSKQNSCIGSSL